MSVCELLRDDVVRVAKVLALVRANGDEEVGGELGKAMGNESPGDNGPEVSDWNDCVLGPRGTVRFFTSLLLPFLGDVLLVKRYSSSGGTSSGGGMGRPRAAAMSWCSAQLSEKSLRPRQNGASRLSICID